MTTDSEVKSGSLITQAIRAAKAESRHAGICDGRCRTCLPDQLRACMARRNTLHRDAEPALASHMRDA